MKDFTPSSVVSDAPAPANALRNRGKPSVFELNWLPQAEHWAERIENLGKATDPRSAWNELVALANTSMDFVRTGRLDRLLLRHFGERPPAFLGTRPVRLALLGSSTLSYVASSLRVAAVRRGIWLTIYECGYGQYFQELSDPRSALHAFSPNAVLFSFDAENLARGLDAAADRTMADAALADILAHIRDCWHMADDAFGCHVMQQTALPIFQPLLGNNEHRLPGSRYRMISALNHALSAMADEVGADLISIDARVAQEGLAGWHDRLMWHHAKQEISPAAAPLYGDLVGRILGARQGRSFKCLVLDLDNTLWGGVIGDDGLEGIVLGQGSALGEAFVEFQRYVLELSRRGVILAVCSKNDEAIALSAFELHPEMVLKREHIACFVANWADKPSNIRSIAQQLNIGLDSMVFVDDSPFERNHVRGELPMVATLEVPDDPLLFAACLANAGYFESLLITEEDRERTRLYQANVARATVQAASGDVPSFLKSLGMELISRRFDKIGLSRIVQLINKTNQFNLTTRRYTEEDAIAVMQDPHAFGLQLRLIDRFGDNGIIAIVIGRLVDHERIVLDTWLMSCRVLGRQVEEATLEVVVAEARRMGGRYLWGEYCPTAKNELVQAHYKTVGFTELGAQADGSTRYELDLESYNSPEMIMAIRGE